MTRSQAELTAQAASAALDAWLEDARDKAAISRPVSVARAAALLYSSETSCREVGRAYSSHRPGRRRTRHHHRRRRQSRHRRATSTTSWVRPRPSLCSGSPWPWRSSSWPPDRSACWSGRGAAADDRRKLETELEDTYRRLREAQAAARPPVVVTVAGDAAALPVDCRRAEKRRRRRWSARMHRRPALWSRWTQSEPGTAVEPPAVDAPRRGRTGARRAADGRGIGARRAADGGADRRPTSRTTAVVAEQPEETDAGESAAATDDPRRSPAPRRRKLRRLRRRRPPDRRRAPDGIRSRRAGRRHPSVRRGTLAG